MRCPKCGYSSFDHLDTCAKCDKELTDVRQDLNLQDFRPEVPFLLGSLVGDYQGAAGGGEQGLSLTQETELALSGLDSSGPITMEQTMDIQGMEQTLDSGAVSDLELDEIALDEGTDLDTAEVQVGDDDELMGLELDMDDLEETLAGGDVSELELTPDDEAADAAPEDTLAMDLDADAEVDVTSDEAVIELDFEDDDLTPLSDDLEDHFEEETAAEASETQETDVSVEPSPDDEDLSEDDLSALAEELEATLIGEPDENK